MMLIITGGKNNLKIFSITFREPKNMHDIKFMKRQKYQCPSSYFPSQQFQVSTISGKQSHNRICPVFHLTELNSPN